VDGVDVRYRPETGCAAQADLRHDILTATAPPAARWLLIESHTPWPRQGLTSLQPSPDARSDTASPRQALGSLEQGSALGSDASSPSTSLRPGVGLGELVVRRCRELGIRPVLIRRYGRVDRTQVRRWGLVDCRPGREAVRWGELPSDEHLQDVLDNKDPGTPSAEPVYLVCTHGRHDACCAVRGRPIAAALTAVYPEQT
jgi:hypothetical protein